jgi:hypothetical protein
MALEFISTVLVYNVIRPWSLYVECFTGCDFHGVFAPKPPLLRTMTDVPGLRTQTIQCLRNSRFWRVRFSVSGIDVDNVHATFSFAQEYVRKGRRERERTRVGCDPSAFHEHRENKKKKKRICVHWGKINSTLNRIAAVIVSFKAPSSNVFYFSTSSTWRPCFVWGL